MAVPQVWPSALFLDLNTFLLASQAFIRVKLLAFAWEIRANNFVVRTGIDIQYLILGVFLRLKTLSGQQRGLVTDHLL